jgi:hypothetical protein
VARVADRSVRCASPTGGSVGEARTDRLIGGQNVNVKLTSTNVSYVGGVFSFDVTVKNLLVQRMGTDGTTVTGIKVFFADEPVATSGTGIIEILNADGVDLFTRTAQPYFSYPGALRYDSVTAPRNWQLAVPPSVGSFSFTVYVSTPLLPVVVFDRVVSSNRDLYRVALDGGDLVRLTRHGAEDRDATVANGKIVFVSARDSSSDLYVMSLVGDTTQRSLLKTRTLQESEPALTPDGRRVAYTRDLGGINRVFVAGVDSLAFATPLDSFPAIQAGPTWRSNTEYGYVSAYWGSSDLWWGITGRRGTTGDTTVFRANKNEVDPAWSADGTRLAFAADWTGDTELYLYTAATRAITRLTTRTGIDGSPTWLRDGRIVFVCYAGSVGHLCYLDPATPGAYTQIPLPSVAPGTGTALRPSAVVF